MAKANEYKRDLGSGKAFKNNPAKVLTPIHKPKNFKDMTTTIDNNQRKFLLQSVGFGNSFDVFCNLKDLPAVIKENVPTNSDYRVFEYWNRKLRRCSKKHLNEMFVANQINFKIK